MATFLFVTLTSTYRKHGKTNKGLREEILLRFSTEKV